MRKHFSYANVMSTLAFFMAVIGGGVAVANVPNNSVTSGKIVDETIRARDIGANAIQESEIATQAVRSDEIGNFTVEGTDVDLGTLTGANVQDGTLQSEDITDGDIDAADVGDGIVSRSGSSMAVMGGAAHNGAYNIGSATAQCSPLEELISGYGFWLDGPVEDGEELFISEINLDHSAESVTVWGGNDSGTTRLLVAAAVCLRE
jgi:hypothetical protein